MMNYTYTLKRSVLSHYILLQEFHLDMGCNNLSVFIMQDIDAHNVLVLLGWRGHPCSTLHGQYYK